MTFNKNCTCYLNCLTCGTFFTSTMCRYLCCCFRVFFLNRVFSEFWKKNRLWVVVFSFNRSMLCLCVFYCNCIFLISVDFLPTNSSIWRRWYYEIRTTYTEKEEKKTLKSKKMSFGRKNSNSSNSKRKETHAHYEDLWRKSLKVRTKGKYVFTQTNTVPCHPQRSNTWTQKRAPTQRQNER